MDYQQSLDRIISRLPTSRQVFLFSATFPVSIKGFMVCLWAWYILHHHYYSYLMTGASHAKPLQD